MNTIGENIAALRKQKGITQEALASAIGVSAQSVSKWENNSNMPDIMLLPIIADVFQISIDQLYGRLNTKIENNAEDAYDLCCDAILETMLSCFYHPGIDDEFESTLARYKKSLETNGNCRTGIIRKQSIVYYRKPIGGLLLKKPESHWYELLSKTEAIETLNLLADCDFRIALAEIIRTQKTMFTISSLCNRCKIENAASLEENLKKSKLFFEKDLDIDDSTVSVYELTQGNRLFLMYALLVYAAEYTMYDENYSGYYCDGSFYFA